MPRHGRGPYLWLERASETHKARWVIRDGRRKRSTGYRPDDRQGAETALAKYIADRHIAAARQGERDPSKIRVADILALYAKDLAPKHARPEETGGRIVRLAQFFGTRFLSEVNGDLCRQFVAGRGEAAGRRELEDLRAAINHHRREGLCSEVVGIALPEKARARERWLTRGEAARLIWAAWRYRETQKGIATDRASRQHVARFALVALYTGTRAAAVCGAALQPMEGRGWIDLERGVFYRRAAGARETKKRQPPVPLPEGLLAHLRRWKRLGQRYAVEWNRAPVGRINKAFAATAKAAALEGVTPHTLRHTAATWLMQAGVDLWEAAGFLGMTPQMLSDTYGHHHPEHLENARKSFRRNRDNYRDNYAGVEREQTRANVTKIAGFSRTARAR